MKNLRYFRRYLRKRSIYSYRSVRIPRPLLGSSSGYPTTTLELRTGQRRLVLIFVVFAHAETNLSSQKEGIDE
jgi:hypothetical protein